MLPDIKWIILDNVNVKFYIYILQGSVATDLRGVSKLSWK